ncbi:MAG: divergent polysaccharide deacetylase family protein [Treponema sp.]|nr:divergent polysaccharide deacetylase family protein [Treponema sp.]
MAQRKKSTSKTKSKKSSKVKLSKGKVHIPAYKIIIFCAVIIVVCITFLLITTIANSESKDPALTAITERFEDIKDNTSAKIEEKSNKSKEERKTQENKQNKSSAPKSENVKKAEESPKQKNLEKSPAPKSESPKVVKTPQLVENQDSAKNNKKVETSKEKAGESKKEESKKPAAPAAPVKKDYNFPKAVASAQLIFVFDDGGQNLNHLEKFLELPFPVTIAVLPQITYSVESAKRVRNTPGKELILHQPMQSINSNVNPGPGAITPDMDEDQIKSILFTNINQIGPVAGFNNHEGSAITADAQKMEVILRVASQEGIYFLDSRTNKDTQVPYVAGELGYSYYERNIFLDNVKTRANVLSELEKGLDYANKKGSVIMIGHVWSGDFLPAILVEVYPELKEKGYTFSLVSTSKARKN